MVSNDFNGKITLAITGASGSAYALRLIECLIAANYQLYILCSSAGRIVLDTEVSLVKNNGSLPLLRALQHRKK